MTLTTLAIANRKGGVGKTSLSVHLAAGFARSGRRVLLVDLDPQANATAWLLGETPAGPGTADALLGRLPPEAIHSIDGQSNLFLLPATGALAGTELALASEVAGETLLRRALQGVAAQFDLALLDCPPSLGVSVLSALVAAEAGVLVPVPASFLALSGLASLEETVERVADRLQVRTRVLGAVLFAADGREAITAETRDLLAGALGDRLFRSEIRVSTSAKALPAHRRTAWDRGADPRGHDDYTALLKELSARLVVTEAA